jgi:hypothetical protein
VDIPQNNLISAKMVNCATCVPGAREVICDAVLDYKILEFILKFNRIFAYAIKCIGLE